MLVLITYDVQTTTPAGQKRLRTVAKACQNWGQRVQYSVFECLLEPAQWTVLRGQLESTIDPQTDSLRYYYLGNNWQKRVEHFGAKQGYNPQGPIII
ncbi:MAG: CRISPR-associated endonuclease Cas2 [Sumerlaeia bacterium]